MERTLVIANLMPSNADRIGENRQSLEAKGLKLIGMKMASLMKPTILALPTTKSTRKKVFYKGLGRRLREEFTGRPGWPGKASKCVESVRTIARCHQSTQAVPAYQHQPSARNSFTPPIPRKAAIVKLASFEKKTELFGLR